MICERCRTRKAVLTHRQLNQNLCRECFNRIFEKRILDVLRGSIKPGDHIVIAASGGKDSTIALLMLEKYRRTHNNFKLEALAIDEGIKGYRDEALNIVRKHCTDLGIKLSIYSFKDYYGFTVDEIAASIPADHRRTPCTYCGVFRRRLLNVAARELGATKLGTGHNLDDIAQAYLMNLIRGDLYSLAKLVRPPLPREGLVRRIMPLKMIYERETLQYTILNGIEVYGRTCKYRTGMRTIVRRYLDMVESRMPRAKYNLVMAVEDAVKPAWEKIVSGIKLKKCKACGEPSSRDLCRVCVLMQDLKRYLDAGDKE